MRISHALLLTTLLAACGDDAGDIKTLPPAPPPTTTEPSAVAPSAGESVALELNAPGGGNGAPEGLNFIVPPGTQAETFTGKLSDDSQGFRLAAKAAGDAVVCTQPILTGTTAHVKTRMKVSDVAPGPQPWQGLNVELRSRTAGGDLVSPQGSRYTLIKNFREAGDWTEWEADVAPAPGAAKAELCYRFVNSTGTVEVDRLEVLAPGVPVAAAPANGAEGATAATGPEVRFELDAPGGGNGAPQGFDFIIPDPTGIAASSGDVGGANGFKFDVKKAGNAVACSQFVPVGPRAVAKGRVKVEKVETDARPWTGFVAELRAYNSAGGLVSAGSTPYVTVTTFKQPGEWQEFAAPVAVPGGAVSAKLCLRFVESTGVAAVDWVSLQQG